LIFKASIGSIETTYPVNSLLHVNAVLIDKTKKVQFVATLAWSMNRIKFTRQVCFLKTSFSYFYRPASFNQTKKNELDNNSEIICFGFVVV
jgi:hypothetical protein